MLFQKPIWAPNVILVDLPINQLEKVIPGILKHLELTNMLIGVNAVSDSDEFDLGKMIIHQEDYEIYRERLLKDENISSHLLKAGVKVAYYIEANKDSYRAAFAHMYDLIGDEYPIICISNSLSNDIESAITIIDSSKKENYQTNSKTLFISLSELFNRKVRYIENRFVVI